ncbi:GTP-binding protein [Tulasnella sp. JGI-2019a]|nr:GTP-binding protein [Tulasnella sp. JGI-2019a]KAG9025742.1 GTP-binding protein [Tulasnella sp. JGI-2019a]
MSYAISEVSPLEVVIFRGGPNEDVSEFLGAIRRVAVIQGRHSDDEWMVSYTESCLRGYAMGWFDEVSSGVPTMDWKSLRKAFLGRFRIQDSYPAYALPPAAVPQASTVAASRRPMVQKAPLPVTVDDSFGDLRAQGFFKKLIIGNSGVGKSCLLSRYLGHGWVPSNTPTAGIHFEVNYLLFGDESTLVKDVYWDASGTEECRTLLGPYCQGMDRIWIVYDVTDPKSFQDVRQWLDLVVRHNPTAKWKLRLIGNKCDLYDLRVIQMQQGRDLASELGIPQFFETSARTNEGVQKMHNNNLGVIKRCKT